MHRRELLKLIALGVVGHTLDLDKLLWVPGKKTIFLPTQPVVSCSDIVALEIERVLPKIRTLFERDEAFYRLLDKAPIVSVREIRVPLELKRRG